ncbi:sigma-70 family RNA polymerase sigma factor [Echinicola strongylocentroti]|uniref:Sigma-70 family RNA polymerase sigma factor n=1 Tax=Echinicola strongylocentroti TaxID=1795355 RepID=A0A2Z4II36_9BACT|nr:sigma-70 family RNA polymerase sigma factor [Echinicola strongylocentroti]AWW30178.1 sigma-70 family RNA polymerase sigma factor [Echinicola strongylocentroti]
MNKEERLIQSIRNGNKKDLGKVYTIHKPQFVDFAKKYTKEEDMILDIYQDSVIILYENILSGKLATLQSSLKTYLFAIGKHKLMEYSRKKGKAPHVNIPIEEINLFEEIDPYGMDLEDEKAILLQTAYRKLGQKCREVLRLFYYEGKKLDEIQQTLRYDSKDTVKSQKSRCLKQLKEIVGAYEKQ